MQLNPRYETEVQPGLVKTGLEGQAGQPVNPRISDIRVSIAAIKRSRLS
jgi:hypothetical protein